VGLAVGFDYGICSVLTYDILFSISLQRVEKISAIVPSPFTLTTLLNCW
jgi:hypothetical protein